MDTSRPSPRGWAAMKPSFRRNSCRSLTRRGLSTMTYKPQRRSGVAATKSPSLTVHTKSNASSARLETDSDKKPCNRRTGARRPATAPFRRYGYSANGQLVNHGAGHGRKHPGRSETAAQARREVATRADARAPPRSPRRVDSAEDPCSARALLAAAIRGVAIPWVTTSGDGRVSKRAKRATPAQSPRKSSPLFLRGFPGLPPRAGRHPALEITEFLSSSQASLRGGTQGGRAFGRVPTSTKETAYEHGEAQHRPPVSPPQEQSSSGWRPAATESLQPRAETTAARRAAARRNRHPLRRIPRTRGEAAER
jgi:hypothetical protein